MIVILVDYLILWNRSYELQPSYSLCQQIENEVWVYWIGAGLQNKMNKIEISRLFKCARPATGMRIIFKKRNNCREKVEKGLPVLDSPTSVSLSRLTPSAFDQHSLTDVKNHVRNRLKTEYNDKFRGIQTVFDQSRLSETPSNRPIYSPKSSRSVKHPSNQSSRASLNCSHLKYKSNDSPEVPNQEPNVQENNSKKLTLDDITAGLEASLSKRLKTCLQFNKNSDWKEDISINSIIEAIKQLRLRAETEDSLSPESSNKKIGIIQQLMAQNTVEGQILKKYYFSKLSQKTTRQLKKESLHTVGVINRNTGQTTFRPQQSFIRTTESRNSYQKHEKEAYQIYRQHNRFFSSGKSRQPLPRSNYSREFLDYRGGIPRMPASKPQESIVMNASRSARSLQSSYRQAFVAKKAETINPKQLDACRDKIRNLPINFGKQDKQHIFNNLNRYIQQKREAISLEKHQEVPFLKSSLLSESRREYRGLKEETPSRIKHRNLEKLKYAFKSEAKV